MSNKTKSLIFIKASVIALGIVLVVLMALLFILKNKHDHTQNHCEELVVKTSQGVSKVLTEENSVIIVTESDAKDTGEIIKVDNRGACPKIINKFTIKNGR